VFVWIILFDSLGPQENNAYYIKKNQEVPLRQYVKKKKKNTINISIKNKNADTHFWAALDKDA